MNVVQKFVARQRDMKTLSKVISSSLERAQHDGIEFAGAQHLVLAALDLDDGTAERAFVDVGSSGSAFVESLDELEAQTLRDLGLPENLVAAADFVEPVSTKKFGKSDATFEAAVKQVYEFHNEAENYRPLLGAHIVAAAASIERGVVARTLRAMHIDRNELIGAARGYFDG